ncbi:MAG: metal-sensing transcriptional repressor [Magnetococcus sp. DMHC-6]
MAEHQTHEDIVLRLKRASGHLKRVIDMIESRQPCANTAQQLHAVINALTNARKLFIQDHIEHCIQDGLTRSDADVAALIRELNALAKYL